MLVLLNKMHGLFLERGRSGRLSRVEWRCKDVYQYELGMGGEIPLVVLKNTKIPIKCFCRISIGFLY